MIQLGILLKNKYTIVTKDNDFNQRPLVFGHPVHPCLKFNE